MLAYLATIFGSTVEGIARGLTVTSVAEVLEDSGGILSNSENYYY